MTRFSIISGFAALMLAAVPAMAQEVGGVQIAPDVMNIPDAQQQALNLAFSLLQRAQMAQQLQQPHGTLLAPGFPAGTSAADPNAVNPAAGRSSVNQQAVARMLGDPGYLAGFAGGQPLAASRVKPPPAASFAVPSQTLVVNAVDSPVSIGDGNIVHQQVANSTAVGSGVSAKAVAGQGGGHGGGGGSASQRASSAAVSDGGIAQSSASNSNVVQR